MPQSGRAPWTEEDAGMMSAINWLETNFDVQRPPAERISIHNINNIISGVSVYC